MTKVFITKYALTQGIFTVEAEIKTDMDGRRYASCRSERGYTIYYWGSDWHLTFESAKIRAQGLQQKKIASLKTQLARAQNLTFEEPK